MTNSIACLYMLPNTIDAAYLHYFEVKSSTWLPNCGLTYLDPGCTPLNLSSVQPLSFASSFQAISPQILLRAVFHQPHLSSIPSLINPISYQPYNSKPTCDPSHTSRPSLISKAVCEPSRASYPSLSKLSCDPSHQPISKPT